MISVKGKLQIPDVTALSLPSPLAEYAAIRLEHGQLLNLIAVLASDKPCLDDWIPAAAVDRFLSICRRNDLHVRSGIQFEAMTHEEAEQVVGANTLTTTRARALRLGDPRGSVHVFVGRDRDAVELAYLAGWYPLVVGNRATSKPWIDHMWFGEALGYPPCCLAAFAMNNNWSVNNMPYQAVKATARPLALCNSIMRFTGLTWAPHLPCSYDCAATESQSARLRRITRDLAPALGGIADTLTTGLFLLLSEWEAFVLHDSERDGNRARYRGVSLVPTSRPNVALFDALATADAIEIRDDLILVSDRGTVVRVEQCRTDTFAPRVPLLVDFAPAERD